MIGREAALDHLEAAATRLRARARSEARWSQFTLWSGMTIVAVIVGLSLAAPLLGIADPTSQDFTNTFHPPSVAHPFGTDSLGRDIFARVVYGARIDLAFGIVTTYIPLVVGVLVGAIAGYFGGWIDTLLMRIVDVVIAFPMMVLVLSIVAITGGGLRAAYIGIFLVGWSFYARITRGEMLALRERQYIVAARGLGYSTWRIIFRHAMPNLLRPNLVFSMADIVLNILTLAALSYLGLGAQPPTPEWGAIVADGQGYLLSAWWISTLPGLAIVLTGIGFSLVGDGLADRLGGDFRMTV